MSGIYGFAVKTYSKFIIYDSLSGELKQLSEYKGKVLLIVNTASQCGFTSQMKDLEAVYQKYKDRGFFVLGFPCDQFMHQEPLKNEEIQAWAQSKFGCTFPLFGKLEVNGDKADPLFNYLKEQKSGFMISAVKWNFSKFLISRNGEVVNRYSPSTNPTKLMDDIEKELKRDEEKI